MIIPGWLVNVPFTYTVSFGLGRAHSADAQELLMFCMQESFLVKLGGLYVVLRLNLSGPCARQTLYLPSYRSSPRHCLDVDISPKDGNPRLTFESA